MCFTGHSTHLAAAASAEREREREREKERERIAAASSDLYLRPSEWGGSVVLWTLLCNLRRGSVSDVAGCQGSAKQEFQERT